MDGRAALIHSYGHTGLEWLDSYHRSLSCKIHAHLDSKAQGPENSFAECFRGFYLALFTGFVQCNLCFVLVIFVWLFAEMLDCVVCRPVNLILPLTLSRHPLS
jgi:hypothetical protein